VDAMPGAEIADVADQIFAEQAAELGARLYGVAPRAEALVARAREIDAVGAALVVRADAEVEREAAPQRGDPPEPTEPARPLSALVYLVRVTERVRAILRPHSRIFGARVVRAVRAIEVPHRHVGHRPPHGAA